MSQTTIPLPAPESIGTHKRGNVFREHGVLVVVELQDDGTTKRIVTTCTEPNQLDAFFGIASGQTESF